MNNSNLYIMNLIKLYLKAYKIAFNDKELYKVLVTDPDFPSLASVSRTLNYYGLSSDAYLLDKLENVTSLKGKLVHSSLNGGHFFVVKKQSEDSLTLFDGKSYSLPVNEFLKVWDGVALMVKEPKNVNAFHGGWLSTQSWMAFLAVLCTLLLLVKYYTLPVFPILLLNSIGLGLSILLMKHRLGMRFDNRYCQIGKKFDCQLVSAKQPLQGRLPFALDELGMFFFFWNILSIVMMRNISLLHFAIWTLASLVCLGLLAYQVFFIHKYCVYCLGTYIVIWLSTLVAIKTAAIPMGWESIVYNTGISACLALLLSNFVSLYFQKQKKSFENEVQLLRFKRNHAVYKALSNDCTIGDGLGMYGIQFGDKGASCKIRMVVSLDCKFCRKAIREAASLIKRFPQRFSCEVILADGSSLVEGLNGYVANRLREFNIIQEYYRGNRNMSILEKLSSKDISEKLELASVISQYKKNQKIIKELSIEKLPLILINGKNKSSYYDISDYQYMVEI